MSQDLIQRIQEAIERSGKSMSSIAEEMGVTPQAVRAWKEGISSPSRERLDDLARATGKSSEWIHLGIGDKESSQSGIISVPLLEVKTSASRSIENYSKRVAKKNRLF